MSIQEASARISSPRANVSGVGISAINMQEAVSATDRLIQSKEKGYICVTGVHGVMEAQKDPKFKQILNSSYLTTPDGMPTVWVGRFQGLRMERVYGPDFMIAMCKVGVAHGYRHFLYGGNNGVAEQLKKSLEKRIPGIQIVGTYTPPFRPLNETESADLISMVRESGADVMWVGLSTPKQERFMAEYLERLDVRVMVGVGAAFDIHTGHIDDAPAWMKQAGLQWFHRLLQDPKRLWKRYLFNNPRFVYKILLQLCGIRKFPLATDSAFY